MKTPTFNLPEIPAEEQTPSVWQMLQIILQLQEHIKQLENEISHLKKHQRDEVRSSATDLKVPPTQPLKETTPTVAETITTPPVAETIKKSPSQARRFKRRVSVLRQPIFTVFKKAPSIPFIGLLILIVWLPLPYGSNHDWAWAVMEVWIFGMALLWLWQYVRGLHKLTPVFYKAIPILVIWVIWLLYITFQCTPLPYAWIQLLSPQAAEAYAFFNPTHTTLSVDSHSTAVGLLKSLSYVLLFTLTLLLVNTRSRLRWVAYALVFSGLFQALYGSLMTLSGLEYGFFHEKVYYRDVATGTFINRNHLAAYLVMCLSVGIGLLIAQLGDGKAPSSWRKRVVGLLDWILSPKMLLRLFLVIMVIALVMTHSRMGNTAFFASMLIAGILTLMLSRRANRATVILLVSLIVIDIFIVGAWFGVEKVAQRLEQTSFSTEKRDEVDIYTIPYWQDYFLTGSGLGSYYTTFPRYQGADVKGFWNHAHNDYLEFAVETGIIGALLLGIALLLTLAMVLIALYRRRRALNRGIAFGVTNAFCQTIPFL
ncbi:MAG TPA: O-antigen ligase family protein [Thioploca sp.]|nr:O-antigen ligase family protein [Thioploca sp.]